MSQSNNVTCHIYHVVVEIAVRNLGEERNCTLIADGTERASSKKQNGCYAKITEVNIELNCYQAVEKRTSDLLLHS